MRNDSICTPTRFSENMVSTSAYSNCFLLYVLIYKPLKLYFIVYIIIIVELWPSVKCHIHTFIFTLFIDDIGFSSKAVISVTLDNIVATLCGNQVNFTL